MTQQEAICSHQLVPAAQPSLGTAAFIIIPRQEGCPLAALSSQPSSPIHGGTPDVGAGGSKHPPCIHEAGCHPCSACRRDPLCLHGLADMLSKMNTALQDPTHTPMSVVGCVGWVWDQQGKGKPVDLDTPLAKPPRHI